MNKILIFLTKLLIIDFIFFLVLVLYMSNKTKENIPSQSPGDIKIAALVAPSTTPNNDISEIPADALIQPTAAPDLFSELSKHSSLSDCWMEINDRLYNVTGYFGQHPGGDAALAKYCGTDATAGFNTKDKSPGVAHSGAAEAMLQQFLIQ